MTKEWGKPPQNRPTPPLKKTRLTFKHYTKTHNQHQTQTIPFSHPKHKVTHNLKKVVTPCKQSSYQH